MLIATILVAAFFVYVYSLKRQAYLLLWTVGWAALSLHYLARFVEQWTTVAPVQVALEQWLAAVAGLIFLLGAQLYAQQKPWFAAIGAAAALMLVWAVTNNFTWFRVPAAIPTALIFFATAVVFYRESRREETLAERLLAVGFAAWAVLQLALTLLPAANELPASALMSVSAVPGAFVAAVMVMALYEEEKRRVERNMLALSNLNLATSSFVGGEIQRMLSQALDRVLGVVRLPAGALFLHHGWPERRFLPCRAD